MLSFARPQSLNLSTRHATHPQPSRHPQPNRRFQRSRLREIAVALFEQEQITLGRASKIAGLHPLEFQQL
ncbi:MAG: UPF0175 family protein [Spirulinaceae cyanobacterium]